MNDHVFDTKYNHYYFHNYKWILLSEYCNSYYSVKVNFHKRGYKISDKKHDCEGPDFLCWSMRLLSLLRQKQY